MIVKNSQIIPVTPAADHSGKDGYFVDIASGEAAISTDATVAPFGVITEGFSNTNAPAKDSIATPGFGGTVKVKITGTSPGTIVLGTKLTLAAEDGTVMADAGSGARVIVAEALESGSGEELIEARLIEPQVIAS